MREHMGLFRGKRCDNSEWVEGNLIYRQIWMSDVWVIRACDNGFDSYEEYEVDPDTLGECTGLKDKNGKLIFEGDIIAIRFESDYEPPSAPYVWYVYAKVIWQDEHLGWYASFEGGDELSMWEYDNYDDVVVVSTVHDNPELFKGGEG